MIKQLMKPVLTGKGPDFSDLTTKECGIGDYQLAYKLPGRALDIGLSKRVKPSQVNLGKELFDAYYVESFFNRTYIQTEFEWWAYKGFYLQGYFGLLSKVSLNIDVNRAESHTPIREGDLDSLESYLKKDYWDYYETEQNKDGKVGANWRRRYYFEHPDEYRAQGYIPLGRLVLVTDLPETYDREPINGVEWLHYSIRGEGVGRGLNYYWAYPLNDSYYLTISFQMSSEVGDKELRYQRMLEDAKRIMSMVELQKV